MSVGPSITHNSNLRAIGGRMGWLFGIVEAVLVLTTLVFSLIAAFLAPAHHETFATLASARQTDFAIAVALGLLSLVAAICAEMLRRKLRQARPQA